jgi:EAL domain-containing protein (putative c-di-GMP-specific phosphodiesterase class I)
MNGIEKIGSHRRYRRRDTGHCLSDQYPSAQRSGGESGVAPEQLVIEVTESEAIGESVVICDVLTRLRIRGVRLAIDDFGTGHSSLMSLLCMPFSELKLDRRFVSESTRNPDAQRILRAIIAMAHEMGLRTVAEGIETESVRLALVRLGCEVGQGWLWSAALNEDALGKWLSSYADEAGRPEGSQDET